MPLMKKIVWLLVGLLVLSLLSWNIQVWHNLILGCLLLGIYLFGLGFLWFKIFQIKFNLKPWPIVTWVLGLVLPMLLISIIGAVAIAWYALTPLITWWILVLVVVITSVFYSLIVKDQQSELALEENEVGLNLGWWRWLMILGYILIWLASWFLLFKSKSEVALLSPWQTINSFYIVLIFFLTIILLLLIFSKIKIKWLLVLILIHSLLIHGYLGVSHQLPYGGDVWRHLGVEQQLVSGEMLAPTLIGDQFQTTEVLGITLPAVLVESYKYIYSQYWAWQVMFNQITNLSLLTIHQLAMPLVWSLVIPVLLFLIGRLLLKDDKSALILALSSCLLFPLQSLGAISMPVSLGLIMFIFGWWLLLSAFDQDSLQLKKIAWVWGLLMFFAYPLYLIIYILTALWLWFWQWQSGRPGKQIGLVGFLITIVSIVTLPAVELISGYSQLAWPTDWLIVVKQIISGLLNWHFVQLVPNDIFTFNWIFNQTPQAAFVGNFFIAWRGWVVLVMILIWLLVIWGLVRALANWSAALRTVASLAGVLFINYFFNWFILSGERIFTRRLDLTLSVFIAVLVIIGVYNLVRKFSWLNKSWLIIIFSVVIAWFGVSTYASGPDLMVVSKSQYNLAQKIWQSLNQQTEKYCVLADDQVLLILEGVSGGKVVGGGFPVYLQYQQPERQVLTVEFKKSTQPQSVIQEAKELTGANQCVTAFNEEIFLY